MLTIAALAMFAGTASARPQFALSGGYETTLNDPFVYRRGLRIGTAVALSPLIEGGASLVYYPILGQGGCSDPDWTPLSCMLLEKNSVSPDISRMTTAGDLELRILPFQAHLGDWRTAVGLAAGGGFVTTSDDLVALQADDEAPDGDAHRTADQLHPTMVGGLVGDVRNDRFGLRIRLNSLSYIETIKGSWLEMKNNLLVRTEVFWWF